MLSEAFAIDPSRLAKFTVVQATDPAELDGFSRVSDRFAAPSRMYKYRLQDRALWRMRLAQPIFGLATRSAGSVLASLGASRFATEVAVEGDADDYFGFTTMLSGQVSLIHSGQQTTGSQGQGLAYRSRAGTQLLIGDASLRTNVFLKVAEVEGALEHVLDERLRRPLDFSPLVDWGVGLAASLKAQLDFLIHEFQRPDGIADNPVALASMTDLLTTLVLRAVPHNYADRLTTGPAGAVPAYVRRAEDFMRANCAEPIRMAQVAAAAGCSVRTLQAVFRQFRDKTALGALHEIRLEEVRRALSLGVPEAAVATVARRYGFTNASRFATAFRRRFGEAPSNVLRRALRS